MKHIYNDGGRAAAGFKGNTGDCVARSIAIAARLPYREVYDVLALGNALERQSKRSHSASGKRTAREGIRVQRKWFKDYMASLGFQWVPTMHIGSGCTVHLEADELPAGRLVVSVSRHYTAVIDGVIHDIYNPAAERGATIYPPGCCVEIPKGAVWLENGNGWAYNPKRCVYGYWLLCEPTERR